MKIEKMRSWALALMLLNLVNMLFYAAGLTNIKAFCCAVAGF